MERFLEREKYRVLEKERDFDRLLDFLFNERIKY